MYCKNCGKEVDQNQAFCPSCGGPLGPKEGADFLQNAYEDYPQMPGKFNWGAFAFCLPWGVGNRCYITLLTLVPILNLVIMILSGFKGNEWAMKNNSYRDMEEFSKSQEGWNRAGKIFFFIYLAIFVLSFLFVLILGPSIFNEFANNPAMYESF